MAHARLKSLRVDAVHERIIVPWVETLAEEDGDPAAFVEGFVAFQGNDSPREKQRHLTSERLRQVHVGDVAPQLGVVAPGDAVMKYDEIPNLLPFPNRHPIVFFGNRRVKVTMREHLDQ